METMTQKDKELLLKDLCARLPYGVVIRTWYGKRINVKCISVNVYTNAVELDIPEDDDAKVFIDNVKPYLFPLSSMTEGQKKDIFCNGTFFINNRYELCRFPEHIDDYDYVTIDDVKIAKNYLTEIELQRLNLLVSQFLDFAELQALDENPMKMQ